MRPNNAAPSARPEWEAPAFTKLPIASRTGSDENVANGPRAIEPVPPGQPLSKLGFSFEWSLPMSTRD